MESYANGENVLLHLHEDPEAFTERGIALPVSAKGLRRGDILSTGSDIPDGTFFDGDVTEVAVFPKGQEIIIEGGLAVINYKRILCTEVGE